MSYALSEQSITDLRPFRVSDERLLGCIARGDAGAFGEFYERHAGAAMGLAFRVVGDERLAEDVCQDAFLGIWSGAATFSADRGSARNWALGVVRNRAVDALRRRAVHARHLTLCEPAFETLAGEARTEEEALRHDGLREIEPRLNLLPARQREAIALAFYVGLTHVEIAMLLGVPVGTIKGRIRLGLQKLRPSAEDPVAAARPGPHAGPALVPRAV